MSLPNLKFVSAIVFEFCFGNETKSHFWVVFGKNCKNVGHHGPETPKRHNYNIRVMSLPNLKFVSALVFEFCFGNEAKSHFWVVFGIFYL